MMDDIEPTVEVDEVEAGEAVEEPVSDIRSETLAKALEIARDQLLDRSLRNRLIHTNLANTRARQIRVFDVDADETFERLRDGKVMVLSPAAFGEQEDSEEGAGDLLTSDAVAVPTARGREFQLQTRLSSEGLQKKLTSLYYESEELEEEQGVNVLFLAVGFLKWQEAKASDIDRTAPLILLPVELVRDGRNDRFKLKLRQDDLYTNVSLQAWMREQFDIDLPDLPEGEEWSPTAYFDAVDEAIGSRKRWAVQRNETLLGFFSFSKFLLWRDLDPANWPKAEALLGHPLLQRILVRRRDEEVGVKEAPIIGDDERIDEVFSPAKLIHVTDADSSQAVAIQEALSGKNLVIQGPPGTGKSQTITNIIAGAVHAGKRVLFVAEKMAALEVVHQRLSKQKLGPLCLELHSRKASKAQVLEQIRQGMTAPAPPRWPETALKELDSTQKGLRKHADDLHAPSALGYSAFEALGKICRLKARGAAAPTFQLNSASDWRRDQISEVEGRAEGLDRRLATSGVPAEHPWRGLGIDTPNMLEQERLQPQVVAFHEAVGRLVEASNQSGHFLGATDEPTLATLPTWEAALQLLATRPTGFDLLLVDHSIDENETWLRGVIDAGLKLNAAQAAVAGDVRDVAWRQDWLIQRQMVARHGRSFFRFLSGPYRTAVADLRGVWNGDLTPDYDRRLAALDALIEGKTAADALAQAETRAAPVLGRLWSGQGSDWQGLAEAIDWIAAARKHEPELDLRKPERVAGAVRAGDLGHELVGVRSAALDAFGQLTDALQLDQRTMFDGADIDSVTPAALAIVAGKWVDRFEDITQWPPIRDDIHWLEGIGDEALRDQVYAGRIAAGAVAPAIMLAAFEAKWNALAKLNPDLARTHGDNLDDLVRRFRKADVDRIRMAADEVARAHFDQRPAGSAGAVGILVEETKKARRLKPVRKLIKEAGEAVQRFKPVFLMSPLSIAQYLEPGVVDFDMMVIDEASQVRPEDALGAMARCRQVIVVGDDKQLPPTNFFNRMINDDGAGSDDEPDEEGSQIAAVRDVESILNLCSSFPQTMLQWHYRSEHPALIATSNRAFYGGRLKLPPSVLASVGDGTTGLLFHKVREGGYERGRTARNEIEAEEVAQAVLRHYEQHPDQSLGIGAFSVAQRDCIRDRIDDLARKNPRLDELLKPANGREALFVKNLENIQGDERDVIFISVGYGRDRDGRLVQNFGPVGRDGGERRLNVLITRARKRCEVFSSIVAEDIKVDGPSKPGVVAFREFLKLAKDGYTDMPWATGREFDSEFEESVAEALRGMGMTCDPQVGMAGFFIDIGIRDPKNPDRYLLGIECDGAAYHSSRYSRDRDRLRQQILEGRGWKLHRIWSTDWFYRQEREVEKLKAAIERAQGDQPLHVHGDAYFPYEVSEADDPASGQAEFEHLESPVVEDGHAASRLRPYEFARFSSIAKYTEPHLIGAGQLADLMTKVVAIEQPIHEEEAGRRLAELAGLQRAGGRIQAAAKLGLSTARRAGQLKAKGQFWTLPDADDAPPRDRSDLPAATPVKKPAMIAPDELRAAALIVLKDCIALPEAELVVETARLLGFGRTGKDVASAIEEALAALEFRRRVERDHADRLTLVET